MIFLIYAEIKKKNRSYDVGNQLNFISLELEGGSYLSSPE